MPEATLEELYKVVDNAIKRGDDVCYDVAANEGQVFGNVKHMQWFRDAMAQDFIVSTRKYRHLKLELLQKAG